MKSGAGIRDADWRIGLGAIGGAATLAAALGLRPLITGGWWFFPAVLVVAVVVATGALMRRSPVPVPLEPAGSAAALVWILAVITAGDSLRWGLLPTGRTLPALQALIVEGRDDAWMAVAPAEYTPGLLLLVLIAVGLAALVVDTVVPGLDLPGLAILPLCALYLSPWVIGVGFPPAWSFVVTMLAWLTLLGAHQVGRAQEPNGAQPGSVPVAAGVSALAVLGALLVSAQVSPASVTLAGEGAGSGNVRIDPRVSLRRALVSQSDTLAATYTTTAQKPEYLRLALLTRFDGRDWRPGYTGEGPAPQRPEATEQSYELAIAGLAGVAVPSPAGTTNIVTSAPVDWDNWLGVPVRADGSSVRGTAAQILAQPLEPSRKTLTASNTGPRIYANDPTSLIGPRLAGLAEQVTQGAANDLERAQLIQQWFTDTGDFTYSLDVPAWSAQSDLDRFLDERTGYCEQFAATMALMARTVGIPARVVVGFTQGSFANQQWEVRATDAHAWPELWIGQAGWLRFEPTPRSESVSAPSYSSEETLENTPQTPAETGEDAPQPTPSAAPSVDPGQDAFAAEQEFWAGEQAPRWPLFLLLAALAAASGPAVFRAYRRARRLRGGRTAPASAYDEIVDTYVDLGLGDPAATPRQTGERVLAAVAAGAGSSLLDSERAAGAAGRIVRGVEAQWYGRPDSERLPPESAPAADVIAVRRALRRSVKPGQRLRGALWPASLWRHR